MKKIIEEGELPPKGYGLSYILYDRMGYVMYPFPINHIVRLCRDLWFKIRHAKIREWEINMAHREKYVRDFEAKNILQVYVPQETKRKV